MVEGDVARHPVVEASALLARWPSLVAIAALFLLSVSERAAKAAMFDGEHYDPSLLVIVSLVSTLVAFIVGAAVILALARALVWDRNSERRPRPIRWFALYVAWCVGLNILSFMVPLLAYSSGFASEVIASTVLAAGAAGAIIFFPMLVRLFAMAAGIDEPKLGVVWAGLFGDRRAIYLWYAVATCGFTVLLYAAFQLIGPIQGRLGNVMAWAVQGGINAVGQVFRYMLAAVAALSLAPAANWQAEAFE
jgi:hypothetical protein